MVNKKVGLASLSSFSRDRSQKKAVWRGYILALILGLIVLSISIYFLFFEYFTSEELDWQECRQSIVLRSNSPDLPKLGTDMKGLFPLKCKTEVVTLDSANHEEIYAKISKAVASGWYMFGRGKFDFVHKDLYKDKSFCVVFARFHYTPKATEEFYEGTGFTAKEVDSGKVNMETKAPKKTFWKEAKDRAAAALGEAPKSKAPEPKTLGLESYRDFYVDFHNKFAIYYKTHKVPGSKGTYDEYLPLLRPGTAKVPHFEMADEFTPAGDDTLLVYRISSIKGTQGSYLGSAATGAAVGGAVVLAVGVIFAPLTLGTSLVLVAAGAAAAATYDVNYWGDAASAKAAVAASMKQRVIIAAPPSKLKSLGCDEYLAIPA